MKTQIVSITKPVLPELDQLSAEDFIVYCARVSSPKNQLNVETAPKLLSYCIRNRHWSIFEMVDLTAEIETSRAIAAQILRHRSFSFQEFSLRYAKATEHEDVEFRMKGTSNRQGSTNDVAGLDLELAAAETIEASFRMYETMVERGVALESARMVLPLCTRTRLYMKGSVRSWIHYFDVRCDEHAQKEHRMVAESIRAEFNTIFPNIAAAMELRDNTK